jgi:hypothetical protein
MTLRPWVPTGSPPPSDVPRLTRRSSYSGPTPWNTCSVEVWVRNIAEHSLRTPSKRSSTGSSTGCGASDTASGHTARDLVPGVSNCIMRPQLAGGWQTALSVRRAFSSSTQRQGMFAPSVAAYGLATSKWPVWLRCVWIGTRSDAPIRSLRSGAYGDTRLQRCCIPKSH